MRSRPGDHSYLSGQGYRMTGGSPTPPPRGPGPAVLGLMIFTSIAIGVVAYLSVRG